MTERDFDIDWGEIVEAFGLEEDVHEVASPAEIPQWISGRPRLHYITVKNDYQNFHDYAEYNKLNEETQRILVSLTTLRAAFPEQFTSKQFKKWNKAYKEVLDTFGIINDDDACYEIAMHLHHIQKAGLITPLK